MSKRELKKLHRRELLAALGAGVGAAAVAACGGSTTGPTATTTTSTNTPTSGSAACAVSPAETRGPYPDTVGMINNSSFFRRDITEGKPGIPLTLTLTVVNVNSACAAVSGVQVEIWQCDATGNYSEYSQPGFNGTGQTFLRGVQTTDANGQVTFNTIYPGWYGGRATHIHVDTSTATGRSRSRRRLRFRRLCRRRCMPAASTRRTGRTPAPTTRTTTCFPMA